MRSSPPRDGAMWRRAWAVAALLLLIAAAGEVRAASFVLDDGSVIEGRLIASTRNTLTIRAEIGGVRQIPRSRLARVRVLTASGRTVAGSLREVRGDRLAIATGANQVFWVEGDRVVGAVAGEPRPAPGKAPDPAQTARREPSATSTTAPARRAPAAPPSAPVEALTRAIAPAAPPAVTEAAPVEAPGTLPEVVVSAAPGEAAEDAGTITFAVTLSQPSDRPISLVYSTVDGEAVSGTDYEPEQGVLTLPAGETRREIETRLIDDRVAEEPEQFFLFVTADPADAALAEKWHAVTIEDDD